MSAMTPLAPAVAGAVPGVRAERRRRLRELDDCLELLEDAHEEGEWLVSPAVSARIGSRVGDIVPGMLITEALDLVFREQETYLAPEDDPAWAPGPRSHPDGMALATATIAPPRRDPEPGPRTLDETSARALTDRIKASANQISLLLVEAHEGRAWSVLGYRSWEHYVRQELGLSRTRSYELLDHGRLIRSIQSLTGTRIAADIPPYAARRVKPHMAEFVAVLRERVRGMAPEDVPALVNELLQGHRLRVAPAHARSAAERGWSGCDPEDVAEAARVVQAAASQGWPEHLDVTLLWTAVDCLAAMPPVPGVVGRAADGTGQRLAGLEFAIEWLIEFTDAWRERLRPAGVAGKPAAGRTLALLGLRRRTERAAGSGPPPTGATTGSRAAGTRAPGGRLPRRATG